MVPSSSPTPISLRWFGCIVAAVFGLLGGIAWWQLDALRLARALWTAGIALAAIYYAVPPLRVSLYRGWMALVTPFGRAVSYVVLALIYFGAITPLGVLLRLIRRDPLRRHFESTAASYWTEHDPGGETSRYLRQS